MGSWQMITDFKNKKLAEYLEPGKKYLVRFGHGWGDTQMFMPAFYKLQELHPDSQIDIYLECGQEEIFESYPDKEGEGYDLVFSLDYPMSEGSALTKTEKCCLDELGIPPTNGVAALPQKDSPFVACHFHGTALPHSVGCPEGVAAQVWQEIIQAGKVPIECHFQHVFHNPVNSKFNFVDSTVRGCHPNLHSLIGLIQHSYAFIGVASGPFVTALSVMPDRLMYIQKNHKAETYTHHNLPTIFVNDYREGFVRQWLMELE